MDVLTVLVALVVLYLFYQLWTWRVERGRLSQIAGKSVLITGCDSGFGNLLAKRLDQLGLRVFAGCLTDAGVAELRQSCSARLQPLKMDVTNSDSVSTAFEVVKEAVGSKGLWGLVNNAGIGGQLGAIEWIPAADYKTVLDVNLLGMIDVTKTFLRLLKKSRGRIVNMSSFSGRVATPLMAPYIVSKFGVEGFSDALRRGVRDLGVTVHIIEPGSFRTNINSNVENFFEMYDGIWARQSAEIKEEYGDHRGLPSEIENKVVRLQGKLEDPADVAKVLEHALCAVRPRCRYLVGRGSSFISAFSCLPTDLGDALLRSMVRKRFTPAAYRAK